MITAPIEMLFCDVDGVLTQKSGVAFGAPDPLKTFSVRDGRGLVLLARSGVTVAFVTGRNDLATKQRAAELNIPFYFCDAGDGKGALVTQLLAEWDLDARRAVFVGDDEPDLEAFSVVGWPVAVADAHPLVRRRARRVTRNPGGHGAVSEIAQWILARR